MKVVAGDVIRVYGSAIGGKVVNNMGRPITKSFTMRVISVAQGTIEGTELRQDGQPRMTGGNFVYRSIVAGEDESADTFEITERYTDEVTVTSHVIGSGVTVYSAKCSHGHETGFYADAADAVKVASGHGTVSIPTYVKTEVPTLSDTERFNDLFERARSLGYSDESAARVADTFVDYDNVRGLGCSTHLGMMLVGGECEACEVIATSDSEGYTLEGWQATQARWAQESREIEAREAAEAVTLFFNVDEEGVHEIIFTVAAGEVTQGYRLNNALQHDEVYSGNGRRMRDTIIRLRHEGWEEGEYPHPIPTVVTMRGTATIVRGFKAPQGKRKNTSNARRRINARKR